MIIVYVFVVIFVYVIFVVYDINIILLMYLKFSWVLKYKWLLFFIVYNNKVYNNVIEYFFLICIFLKFVVVLKLILFYRF